MGDIFNHALDAYESEMSYFGENHSWRESSLGPPDPLFYHHKMPDGEVVGKTDKSKLVQWRIGDDLVECWYPSSWVKVKDDDIYVWTKGILMNNKSVRVVL